MSDPSLPSQQVCKTDQNLPEKNPENVIGEGDEPDNLVIYWTVCLQIQNCSVKTHSFFMQSTLSSPDYFPCPMLFPLYHISFGHLLTE